MEALEFPFEAVGELVGRGISDNLTGLERYYHAHPQLGLSASLNAILVWCGARNATLPSWGYFESPPLEGFINYLNEISRQISPTDRSNIDEIGILNVQVAHSTGNTMPQALVVRCHSPRIVCPSNSTSAEPTTDYEIGRELGMYEANARYFQDGMDVENIGFSILEAESHVLLFSEVWNPNALTPAQLQEYISTYCERKIDLWNLAMERLGLRYRFYGNFLKFRCDVRDQRAQDVTALYYSKAFFGVKQRAVDAIVPSG